MAGLKGAARIAGQEVPLLRFMGFPPSAEASGDLDSMAFYAGQGVGPVREVKPAADVVRELMADAARLLENRLAVQAPARA